MQQINEGTSKQIDFEIIQEYKRQTKNRNWMMFLREDHMLVYIYMYTAILER